MSFVDMVNPVTFLVVGLGGILLMYAWKRSNGVNNTVLYGSLLVTFLLMHYFRTQHLEERGVSGIKPGQSLRVPVQEQVLVQPLLLDINLCDQPTQGPGEDFVVETPHAHILFSLTGAVISRYQCKRLLDGKPGLLTLWNSGTEYKDGAFLLAFDEATPVRYTLREHRYAQDTGVHTICFEADGRDGKIEKTFMVYDGLYRIDLAVTVAPKTGSVVRPRIFVPGPLVPDLLADEVIQGIAYTDRGRLEKFPAPQVEGRLWVMPTLFGVEDRYFVSALVGDRDGFVERAYYRLTGARLMTTIIEGPSIADTRSWHLSWYCGPKQAAALTAVDTRLVATLDYGWLSPISSLLFMILQMIYEIVKNYGVAIILVTLLLKLLLLPFTLRADQSQKRMVDIQRKLQAIERKYHDDPERRELEKTELIRKHGLGDVFGIGCLPRILQVLIFIGLNRVLSVSIELYRAPFYGWLTNLAAPDPLYVLPIITGFGIFFQVRKIQGPRQVLTTAIMSLIITAIMMNFNAGVVLFIAVSTWLDVAQNMIQERLRMRATYA